MMNAEKLKELQNEAARESTDTTRPLLAALMEVKNE